MNRALVLAAVTKAYEHHPELAKTWPHSVERAWLLLHVPCFVSFHGTLTLGRNRSVEMLAALGPRGALTAAGSREVPIVRASKDSKDHPA
jgi:hypothetical protein